VGSFEQHGAHLPLTTDTLVAQAIAEAVSDTYDLLLLPPVTFSCSHEHGSSPGTVSISAVTLIGLIRDIAASLRRSGIHALVLVNGHGGNYVLSNVVQETNVDGPAMTLFPGKEDWAQARAAADLETSSHDDMHAGELETSILLHAHPELVRPGWENADAGGGPRPHLLLHGMKAYTDTGVIGRPSLATAEKGKRLLDSLTDRMADHLEALGLSAG
jgi:creatinine amidohydrolase